MWVSQPQIPVVYKHQHKRFPRYAIHVYKIHAPLVHIKFAHYTWLLIDTRSTFNSICNHLLLRSVRPCSKMKSLSNRGMLDYTQYGSLSILPDLEMYYNPQSVSNLLSMSTVTSKYHVTLDSEVKNVIVVHLGRNQNIKFNQCVNGLCYFDNDDIGHVKTPQDEIIDDYKTDKSKSSVTNYSFLSTVVTNKEYFSPREIEGADNARLLQGRLGWTAN